MSLNSLFDSIDTDAQFDVWKKTITQKLIHLKNIIPIENRDELNYVGETLEFINSLNLLSSDFLAHHPNMDNKKTLLVDKYFISLTFVFEPAMHVDIICKPS